MRLIFCLDSKNGMMFGWRRQTQDRVLRQWIIDRIHGNKLWMSNYSAKQFQDQPNLITDDDYSSKAGPEDFCFVEDGSYSIESADEVILCHWNRRYPADKFFNVDLKSCGFRKSDSLDIKGSSHERITIEIYRRIQHEER